MTTKNPFTINAALASLILACGGQSSDATQLTDVATTSESPYVEEWEGITEVSLPTSPPEDPTAPYLVRHVETDHWVTDFVRVGAVDDYGILKHSIIIQSTGPRGEAPPVDVLNTHAGTALTAAEIFTALTNEAPPFELLAVHMQQINELGRSSDAFIEFDVPFEQLRREKRVEQIDFKVSVPGWVWDNQHSRQSADTMCVGVCQPEFNHFIHACTGRPSENVALGAPPSTQCTTGLTGWLRVAMLNQLHANAPSYAMNVWYKLENNSWAALPAVALAPNYWSFSDWTNANSFSKVLSVMSSGSESSIGRVELFTARLLPR